MTGREPSPLGGDWDRLSDREDGEAPDPLTDQVLPPAPVEAPAAHGDGRLPPLMVVAAAWGDLVAVLAVSTAALAGAAAAGNPVAMPALPWAAVLALVWWISIAAATVVVRQATPGMLMAGLRFSEPVATRRVPWVLAAAVLQLALLGLPSAVPATGRGLLSRAGRAELRSVEPPV